MDRWLDLTAVDPTGALELGLRLAERYLPNVRAQHALMIENWRKKQYEQALVHLHFMLTALDRVKDGLGAGQKPFGISYNEHLGSLDLSGHKRARDHFEHIEDRLFGRRKGAVKPISEAGVERTVHYGLSAKEGEQFAWGDESIDISEAFVRKVETWAQEALSLAIQEAKDAKALRSG